MTLLMTVPIVHLNSRRNLGGERIPRIRRSRKTKRKRRKREKGKTEKRRIETEIDPRTKRRGARMTSQRGIEKTANTKEAKARREQKNRGMTKETTKRSIRTRTRSDEGPAEGDDVSEYS